MILDKIFDYVERIKNNRKYKWIIIITILFTLIFYPIIDANFLYYERTKKRIDIINNISKLDINEINKDERIKGEYESILNDIDMQKEKNINSIIRVESTRFENICKCISASWIFILVGIFNIFSKQKETGKINWKNNILVSVCCFIISVILSVISLKIPIFINLPVTCIIIVGVIIYLAYTISQFGNKKKQA